MRRKFITEIELDSLELSNCRMTLENDDILKLTVKNFTFLNNEVENVVTEALMLNVSSRARIENNTFQHLQLKSFTNISPLAKSSSLEIRNNRIENFESGFLTLNPAWERLEIEDILLLKHCECHFNLFNADSLEVIKNNSLMETVEQNTFCSLGNESGNFSTSAFRTNRREQQKVFFPKITSLEKL